MGTACGLFAGSQTASASLGVTTDTGIAIGCFIGALSFMVDDIPVSLSTSGGALFSGLFFGWLRSRKPTCGYIPTQVSWVFDKPGLNMFIAVIGLTSGPKFISGIAEVGVSLFYRGNHLYHYPPCPYDPHRP